MLYNVIYADPPWSYENDGVQGNASDQYSLMSTDSICRIPVASVLRADALLFIWVTFPCLEDGLRVIRTWGFQYKTLGFNWVKTNKRYSDIDLFGDDRPVDTFFGTGFYTRSNSELCLIGTRGQATQLIKDKTIESTVISNITKHSQKPEEVRKRIEALTVGADRLELFAREPHSGWTCLGNEIDGKDISKSILQLL